MVENMKKNISKAKAFQIVVDNMKTLCYEQTIEHRTSLLRIAGLIGLCELVLIIIVIALSVSGWDMYGIIIISMIAGSFVTNMLWFSLMRREVRIWKG